MSLFDYHASRVISAEDHPFYGLLMALMRRADSENAAKLRAAWPDVWGELQARYSAPGGLLADETSEPEPLSDIEQQMERIWAGIEQRGKQRGYREFQG